MSQSLKPRIAFYFVNKIILLQTTTTYVQLCLTYHKFTTANHCSVLKKCINAARLTCIILPVQWLKDENSEVNRYLQLLWLGQLTGITGYAGKSHKSHQIHNQTKRNSNKLCLKYLTLKNSKNKIFRAFRVF